MAYSMKPGSKNIDSPGSFSVNNSNTISALNPDPEKKNNQATTTVSNALASDKDYQVVPGYEKRLGGELGEVILTGEKKKPKKKSFKEKHGYTRVGGDIDDIKYGRLFNRPLNWGTLSSRGKERKQRRRAGM